MTLHVVARSPWADPAFDQCRRVLAPGDALLLCGDGVNAALPGTAPAAALAELATRLPVHALEEDCSLRGIAELPPGVQRVDYAAWVALACAHPRSVTWS